MSDNPTKHEVLIKQYLHSILDISVLQPLNDTTSTTLLFMWEWPIFEALCNFYL